MKKVLYAALSVALVLGGCSKPNTEEPEVVEEQATGGWQINNDETIAALPEDVQKAFEQACEGYTGMGLTPIAYLGCQAVNGWNYKLLCKGVTVTQNPETKLVVVEINADPEGKAEILQVNDFDFTALEDDPTQTGIPGGWQINDDYQVVNMPAEVQGAFDDAMKDVMGVTYEPMAYLASQVVSGTNYCVLCHTTTMNTDNDDGLAVVQIYQDLDGKSEVTSITQINLANV